MRLGKQHVSALLIKVNDCIACILFISILDHKSQLVQISSSLQAADTNSFARFASGLISTTQKRPVCRLQTVAKYKTWTWWESDWFTQKQCWSCRFTPQPNTLGSSQPRPPTQEGCGRAKMPNSRRGREEGAGNKSGQGKQDGECESKTPACLQLTSSRSLLTRSLVCRCSYNLFVDCLVWLGTGKLNGLLRINTVVGFWFWFNMSTSRRV